MIDRVVGMVGELRGHPALLAIVILQIVTMGVIYFISTGNAERTAARELALIEACKEGK
jgi:hypothetical protein